MASSWIICRITGTSAGVAGRITLMIRAYWVIPPRLGRVGQFGRPDHTETLENNLIGFRPLQAAPGTDPGPVLPVLRLPACQGQVVLAFVPGERFIGAGERAEAQFDGAQDDARGAGAGARDPGGSNTGKAVPGREELVGEFRGSPFGPLCDGPQQLISQCRGIPEAFDGVVTTQADGFGTGGGIFGPEESGGGCVDGRKGRITHS